VAERHFPLDANGNGSILEMNLGVNIQDNYLKMRVGEAEYLKDMLYQKDTPIKRDPFSQYNTEDWSGIYPFRGAHQYIDKSNVSRILAATSTGAITEIDTASHTDRVTGLSVNTEVTFETALGRVITANGAEAPRVGDETDWRVFGAIAAVSDLDVAATGSGSFTGTWYHIVIPVKEISEDVAEIYADWSNVIETTAVSKAQFGLTWTDIVDTRIDKYWVFRTRAGNTGPYYRVARVDPGDESYTDTTTDANLSVIKSPLQGVWGTCPIAKYVAYSGNRVAMGNLVNEENAVQVSQRASGKYDVEAFHTGNQSKVLAPGNGPLTGIKAIGDRGDETRETNHLFMGQNGSCYLLPETDPRQPLIEISGEIGLIGPGAIAQWNSYVFWVDKKRGLVYWRFGQDQPWKIGDKIDPVFFGGGNLKLLANQGDDNIKLEVWNDQLKIITKNNSTTTGGDRAYLLDLSSFIPADEKTARETARFTGPFYNQNSDQSKTLGFSFCLPLLDRTLLLFDNQNGTILKNDSTATQDYIGGDLVNIQHRISTGALLAIGLSREKAITYAYVNHFSSSDHTLYVMGEYSKINVEVDLEVINTSYEWFDDDDETFPWETDSGDPYPWSYDSFGSEGPVNWGAQGKWFRLDLQGNDTDKNYAFFGFAFKWRFNANTTVSWV
jgi:hypothetical protein